MSEASLANNYNSVRARIAAAAERAGRPADQVELVAVSKGHPAKVVRQAHLLGMTRFGENRVGEGLAKLAELSDLEDLRWDMIGHVQSRKAKDVAPNFDRVHSVDRLKIARYLDRYAEGRINPLPVLLECNVSGEGSKYGFDISSSDRLERVLTVVEQILRLPHLQVLGLMTMAPWEASAPVVRDVFRGLREFRDQLRDRFPETEFRELSMGMTDDFEIAVEEGATIVRIGRALFGPRDR